MKRMRGGASGCGLPPSAVPTDQEIIDYMEREKPQAIRCPLCDSARIKIRYAEWLDGEREMAGDRFRCPDCGAEGEYE